MPINRSIFSDHEGNSLRLSSVLQTEEQVFFEKFSIKYVVSGKENYTVNNRKIDLNEGEYITGNCNTTSTVLIDNPIPVRGICVDIAEQIITEVIEHKIQNPNKFGQFILEQQWMVQKNSLKNSTLGHELIKIAAEFDNLSKVDYPVNKSFFYTLAESIINDQVRIYQDFSKLKFVKEETNGHLFNFINDAKNYIDYNFLKEISIENIANEAKLSEYHFMRLFKTVFNKSPYQYLLEKKLEYSLLLLKDKYSTAEISFMLGYNDSSAFCNAFKKHFGNTPKYYK